MRQRTLFLAYNFVSFLLPGIVLSLASWMNGLYPFGSEAFLFGDQRTQYLEFYSWLKDVLSGNADATYATNQALGSSTIPMVGYYLASPFNLFLMLFDKEKLSLFCFLTVLLKVGCIQLTMQFYLRKRFALTRIWASAIGLGFTLSMWTITQLRCPMWLDGLIFLPLCAWGVCCLLHKGTWRLLAFSFGACVLACWYMGYIIGLFLCLYFLFEQYALRFDTRLAPTPNTGKQLASAFGALALGLCLSAVIFLPCVLAMLDSGTAESGVLKTASDRDPILERLPFLETMPLEHLTIALILIAVVVILGVFWLLRKRSLRFRSCTVLLAGLILCLIGCLAFPALQHGSALDVLGALFYGKWVDSKTPQLFASFLVLVLGILFFMNARVPTKLKIAAGSFLFLLLLSSWLYPLQFIWGGFRLPSGFNSRMSFLFIFMMVWCASFSLRILLDDSDSPKALSTWVRRSSIAALALLLTITGVSMRTTITWESLYVEPDQIDLDSYIEAAFDQVAELEQLDPGVYRVEKSYLRLDEPALNEGLSLGIDQISSYTSTGDQAVLDLLSALGFGDGHFYTYALYPSLLGDSLLGVKYMSSGSLPFGFEDVGLTSIKVPEAKFYENPYALSLAYGVPESIVDFQMPEGTKWECLNAFANALAGTETAIYLNTEELDDQTLEQTMDMPAFTQLIDQLKAHQFTFNEFGGSHISGTMNAAEGQMLLMTIPNQTGWSVTVNGEPVEPQDVAEGALMAIPVQPGENQVEMQFTPPGLIPGTIISLLALLFLLMAPNLSRRMTKRDWIFVNPRPVATKQRHPTRG